MTRARDINRVRLRREERGLLLKDLAVVARDDGRKIGSPLLSMIEGGYVPAAATRRTIAGALDTTPELLWPEEYA